MSLHNIVQYHGLDNIVFYIPMYRFDKRSGDDTLVACESVEEYGRSIFGNGRVIFQTLENIRTETYFGFATEGKSRIEMYVDEFDTLMSELPDLFQVRFLNTDIH